MTSQTKASLEKSQDSLGHIPGFFGDNQKLDRPINANTPVAITH